MRIYGGRIMNLCLWRTTCRCSEPNPNRDTRLRCFSAETLVNFFGSGRLSLVLLACFVHHFGMA
jgi:hypothetical protein